MPNERHEGLIKEIFANAAQNPDLMKRLKHDPADVFAEACIAMPESARFNTFFKSKSAPLLAAMEQSPNSDPDSWPSLGCGICLTGVWSIAVFLAAMGAGALSELMADSPIITTIARWCGRSPTAVLEFLESIIDYIGKGIEATADQLCEWINACP